MVDNTSIVINGGERHFVICVADLTKWYKAFVVVLVFYKRTVYWPICSSSGFVDSISNCIGAFCIFHF